MTGAALLAAGAACNAPEVADRSRFVEDGVTAAAVADWAGEKIVVDNAGVSPVGGVAITTDTGTKRIEVVARLLAIADTQDKPSADRAIDEAKKGLQDVTTAGDTTTVDCGHPPATGSVASAEAGCDALDVSLPAGTEQKPLQLAVRSGQGKVRASFDAASFIGTFELRGSLGAIDVTLPSNRGAIVTVIAESGDPVILHLPPAFAADLVTLETAPGNVDVVAFPDVASGKGRGPAGQGAKSITVRTTGRITLVRAE